MTIVDSFKWLVGVAFPWRAFHAPEEMTERERWLLWAANRSNAEIRVYSGLQQVPGGIALVIGPYSSERLQNPESIGEDIATLRCLIERGLVAKVSASGYALIEAAQENSRIDPQLIQELPFDFS